MKKFRERFIPFYENWKHLLILLYFIVYMAWFNYVEQTVTTHFHEVHVSLDDYIPFCEYFVIPYVLWFGYVAWGVIFFARRNVSEYYKLCGFLFTGMTLFLIISTIYPNGHYLRPTYFSHHNFCTTICEWLYKNDTATNLFPSIHVYNSLAIEFAVINSKELKNNKTVKLVSTILCISIIMATMFVKQHSVFDVTTAIILSLVMYQLIYGEVLSKLFIKVKGQNNNKNKNKSIPQM